MALAEIEFKLEPQTQTLDWHEIPVPHKIKVLCLSLWFPLSMSRYFEDALKHNPNIDLITTGPFTGSWTPWKGGMTLPEKYSKPPTIPLPFQPNIGKVSYDFVRAQLPKDWIPDIVLCIDAGITWNHKPSEGYVAHIGTDSHVLSWWYEHSRKFSDKFFNMQLCYKEQSDTYLPYAYNPRVHFPMPDGVTPSLGPIPTDPRIYPIKRDTDAVLIGMPYENRVQWIDELRKRGVSVIFENAPVFDEYRELANRARIGLNWSSPTHTDLNARFFEMPAFGLAPVTNRVPDAHLFLTENEDYLGFDNLNEAVEKVMYLKNNPDEIKRLSANAHKHIQGQTYDARILQVLRECGFE